MTFRAAGTPQSNISGLVLAHIPAGTVVGDKLTMVTIRGANIDFPTVDGWTKLGQGQANSLTVALYERTATAGDADLTFGFPISSGGRWMALVIAEYNVAAVEAFAFGPRTTSSATLTTPTVSTATANCTRLDVLVDKGNPPAPGTQWSTVAAATIRTEKYDTGNGSLTAAIAEANALQAAGTVGGIAYTQTIASPQAVAATITRRPAGAPATVASAGADISVDVGETFQLDGSASTPGGGTYAWPQQSGGTTALTGGTTATPSGTPGPEVAGTDLVYELTYTANAVPAVDTVTVHVNPSANPDLYFQENFEGGADGVAISTSNTGWTSASGAGVFSDDWAIQGTRSYRSAGLGTCRKTLPAATHEVWYRWYDKMPAAPPSNAVFAQTRDGTTSIGGVRHITSTGTVTLLNGASAVGSPSAPFTAGEIVRFEHHVNVTGSTQELRIFRGANVHGTTPDESLTGAVTGTELDDVSVSNLLSNVAYVREIDAVAASLVGWVGPIAVSGDQPPVADAGPDRTVDALQKLEVIGSAVNPVSSNLQYSWDQTSGDALTDTGSGAQLLLIPPAAKTDKTYGFTLTVTDLDTGLSDTDVMTLTVPAWRRWRWDGAGFDTPVVWDRPTPPPEPEARLVSVAVLGDSLTYANGAGPQQITDRLALAGWNPANVRVDGLTSRTITGGNATPTSIDVVRAWRADGFDPRVWLVALGSNNKNAGESVWLARINELCDEIASGPEDDYVIYWVGMGFKDSDTRCTAFASTMATVAAARTDFTACDYEAYLAPLRASIGWADNWYPPDPDGVHMTAQGYTAVRWPFYVAALQTEVP